MTVLGPFNYTGGLNTRYDIFSQPQNTLANSDGFRVVGNSLKEMFISTQINSSQMGTGLNIIHGIIPNTISANSAGSFPYLVNCDGHIYTVTPTGTINDISGGNSYSGAGAGRTNAAQLNGIMVFGDNNTASGYNLKWDGTTMTKLLTASADFAVLRTCNNFMFGITTTDSTVWWSNVADPTTWNVANFITFRKGDGDIIVDIQYIGTDLYIFKHNSIGRLSTVTTTISGAVTLGPLTTVYTGIGCASPFGTDRMPDGRIAFMGTDAHAYLFDGSVIFDISDQPEPSANIQTTINAQYLPMVINGSGITCVYPPRNEIWFGAETTNLADFNILFIYNYKNNAWSYWTIENIRERYDLFQYVPNQVTAITPLGALGTTGSMVAGVAGVTYQMDPAVVTSTGTSSIAHTWQASINLGAQARTFVPRSMIIPMVNSIATNIGVYTVTFAFDGGSFGGSFTLPISTSYRRVQIPIPTPPASYSTIQIKCTGNASLALNGATFDPFYLSDEVLI